MNARLSALASACVLGAALSISVLAAGSRQAPAGRVESATLVLRNGRVETMDEAKPAAQAIAIGGDRIVAVGTNEEIRPYVGSATKVIDLRGALATPGLIDSHVHFTGIGDSKQILNLKVRSWSEIVAMVGEEAKKRRPGEVIRGRGWHQEKWDTAPRPNVEGFPTHESLDRVSPNNPVILTHESGHATFVNGKTLEMSGITRDTPNPAGGEILKDKEGNPTGLLRETASRLVREDSPTEEMLRKRIELADKEVLSKGLTSVHDAGSSYSVIDVYKKVVSEGKLGARVWIMARDSNQRHAENMARYRMVGFGNNHLTVRAIKMAIDGALGSRGAWLLEPYADKPDSAGHNTTSLDVLAEGARIAMANDYQVCIHAIGDRGNREVLNIYEAAFKANPDKKNLRWRIEHSQHLSAADIPRFGRLGVIASMEGIHATSDAPYVLERLGPKRAEEGAYVWQKLLKSGAVVTNGTDAPVEDVDPIASFYASVSRKTRDGKVFYGEQRMSRKEALESYTLSAAHAAFEEELKGSLTKGKLADVTVFSKDIMTVPEDQIPTAQVLYTIVGGQVLYSQTPMPGSR